MVQPPQPQMILQIKRGDDAEPCGTGGCAGNCVDYDNMNCDQIKREIEKVTVNRAVAVEMHAENLMNAPIQWIAY